MGNSPSKDGSNSTATTLNSTGSSTLLSPPQPANDDPDPSRSSSSRSHINQQALNSHIINSNSSSLDDTKKSRALNIKNTSNDTQITTNTTTITRHSHSSISRSKPFNAKLKPSSSPSSISSNSPPSRHNSHSNSHPNSHPNSNSHSHSHHQSNNHGSTLKPSKSNRSTTSSSSPSPPSSSSPSSSSSTAPTSTTGYSNNNISPFELELAASTAKAFNISRSPKSNITSTTGNSNNDEMASSVSSNVSGFTAESVTSISSVTTSPPNLKDIQSLYPIDERSVENTPEPSSNYSSLNYNLSSSSSTSLLSQSYSPAPTDDNNHKNNNDKNFNDLQIFNQEIEDHFEITKIPTSNSSTTDSTLTDSKIKSIDMKKKISTNKKSKSLERTSTSSTSNSSGIDLDTIINDLINLGLSKKLPRKFNLSQKEIKYICAKARDTFLHQPMLLELAAPVKVVGDLHGQFNDLLRIFKMCGYPPNANYLFLGDYVDRGKQSLETMILLLCLKVKYPENFFLLRGNHESASITKMYGFFDECKRRSNVKTWKIIVDVFNTLPVAATIADRIFCVHGGLSPQLTDLKQIKSIQRPTDIPETGLLADLLWSDPESSNSEWSENDRGVSYCFNKKVVNKFNDRFEFDLIARGHMVVEQGYEFFAKRKLVTIFSAPNYCGEFNNWGAVMNVDKKLMCSFELLKPNAISNSSNSLSPFKK